MSVSELLQKGSFWNRNRLNQMVAILCRLCVCLLVYIYIYVLEWCASAIFCFAKRFALWKSCPSLSLLLLLDENSDNGDGESDNNCTKSQMMVMIEMMLVMTMTSSGGDDFRTRTRQKSVRSDRSWITWRHRQGDLTTWRRNWETLWVAALGW